LIPGLIVVWAVRRALQLGDVADSGRALWQFIIIAYLTGQLLQTVSSEQRHWLRAATHLRSVEQLFPDNQSGSFAQEKLIPALREAFGKNPSTDWFYLCESYLQVRKLDSYTEIMHERYGFFRGLFLALVISAVGLVLGEVIFRTAGTRPTVKSKRDIFIAALCLVGAPLSFLRMNDFDKYYGKATYETFYVDHKLLQTTSATTEKR
jgi:hypothetical protein